MLEFIAIKEVGVILGYKRRKSVIKWCRNYQIEIFKYRRSNKPYILKCEFEFARESECIKYLNAKYGQSNLPAILNQQRFDYKKPELLLTKYLPTYRPQGNIEKEILKVLTSI